METTNYSPDETVKMLGEIFEDLSDYKRAKIGAAIAKISSAHAQLNNITGDMDQVAVGAAGRFLSEATNILIKFRDTEIQV